MPHDRYEWLGKMKAVEREYLAVRQAVDRLITEAGRDPNILLGDVKPRDVDHASKRLEGTCIVRLFAEFESGLRLYWQTIRQTRPRMEDLIHAIATNRTIPDKVCSNAHAVREHRNNLVHEREKPGEPLSIAKARQHLCVFFDRLPLKW